MNEVVSRITGMACASCARQVEDTLRSVAGVQRATVSYAQGLARVSGDVTRDANELITAVAALGYQAGPVRASAC
jgi:mercuric reductase